MVLNISLTHYIINETPNIFQGGFIIFIVSIS